MAPISSFEFLPLGAIIQSFLLPTKKGPINIVQGFPNTALYKAHNSPFFGETIGRVANRIDKGLIKSLNGKSYQLGQNDNGNALHGGEVGWGKKTWEGPTPLGSKTVDLGAEAGGKIHGERIKFTLKSEDGDEGYPGTVLASVIYTTATQKNEQGKNVRVLEMEYEVELLDGAEETVVNMTNHSYFNLTSTQSIEGTEVTLCSGDYLPVTDTGIPTGGPTPFEGVIANKTFTLGPVEPDIDDCFVVHPASAPEANKIDTRSLPLKRLVAAYYPPNGTHLEVLSTEPAFQFYTGRHTDVPEIEYEEDGQKFKVPARPKRSAFCVEPSRYVNAINEDEWRAQVLLKKGEKYGARIVYRGWGDEE
ncbi:putative bifunctional protein gal10 [Xylogone sp. PMI_703]|nr:putative bifunctional protein gal10 [Xylogone sp. PMI_703]